MSPAKKRVALIRRFTRKLSTIYDYPCERISIERYGNDFDVTFLKINRSTILDKLPTMTVTKVNKNSDYCYAHENSNFIGPLVYPTLNYTTKLRNIFKNRYCHFNNQNQLIGRKERHLINATSCLYDQILMLLENDTNYQYLKQQMKEGEY